MLRLRKWAVAAGVGAAAVLASFGPAPSQAQNNQWVTIKGQIVWKGAIPVPGKPDIKTDKEHCLSKGGLVYEDLQINPKTKGVKNVWVYLKPATGNQFPAAAINPALAKAQPKEHVIDQPCCQFVPRVLAVRDGDTLLVKNSAPVPHNVNYNADNDAFNQTVPAGGQYKHAKPLAAQLHPITFKCDIHPWMAGRIMVFDHPYYALTDENGNFEIKGAPAGNFRIFYRHENGYHQGKAGAKGFPIDIKAGNGGTMQMKPVELELPKPN
jgi:plastocyanin